MNIVSFTDWITGMLTSSVPGTGLQMIYQLLYSIWQSRNEWVFKGKRLRVEQILERALAYNLPQVEPRQKQQQYAQRMDGMATLKVFFDASVRPGSGTGMGMVVQDAEGGFMAAATHLSEESFDVDVGEALAFRWTLSTLEELGIDDASIFSDSLNVCRWALIPNASLSYLNI
ncbi:hypothetical protein RIF29_22198 [Crotalaria pallida]|uniref:RNase H type-1 domain-containing protein n=1 Tax=Crotalaria pallida TaxID=3830 RepID=A0AAN9IE84_CROPI